METHTAVANVIRVDDVYESTPGRDGSNLCATQGVGVGGWGSEL